MDWLQVLAAAWAAWCLINFVVAATFDPQVPACTLFRVVIPQRFHDLLTPDEYEALRQHELGHRHYWHPWINLVLACFFIPLRPAWRVKQELQADDFAATRCGPLVVSMALRKLLHDPFGRYRSDRLERQFLTEYSERRHGHAQETDGSQDREAEGQVQEKA